MSLTLPARTSSIASIDRKPTAKITDPGISKEEGEFIDNEILSIVDQDGSIESEREKVSVENILSESLNYDPSRSYNRGSPISDPDSDITPDVSELVADGAERDILSSDQPNAENEDQLSDASKVDPYIPSGIVDYYSEAVSANYNTDTERYGLPHLMQYPLNTVSDVIYAAKHFNHCLDTRDKITLAKNISEAAQRFHIRIQTDVYNTLLKTLNESTETKGVITDMVKSSLRLPMSNDNEEIRKSHIHYNTQFMNNLFYNRDYAKSIANMKSFDFINVFYPNMITHTFIERLHTSLGGLGMDEQLYAQCGLRYPLETDFSKPIGWISITDDELAGIVAISSDTEQNWFRVTTTNNIAHVKYCLTLYSIVGEILLDPHFTMNKLDDRHIGIISYWLQHVTYHCDRLEEYGLRGTYTHKHLLEMQYLHDLMWSFLDSPYLEEDQLRMILGFASNMTAIGTDDSDSNMKYDNPNLIDITAFRKYVFMSLKYDERLYLIPELMEYPILDRTSIRLAIDQIQTVEKEFSPYLEEFCRNVNRAYVQYGCTFKLSIDHPFMKYASKNIQREAIPILSEGETVVSNSDSTVGLNSTDNQTNQPWYKRLDYIGSMYRDGSENKEMGPNTKPQQFPDYTQSDSFL